MWRFRFPSQGKLYYLPQEKFSCSLVQQQNSTTNRERNIVVGMNSADVRPLCRQKQNEIEKNKNMKFTMRSEKNNHTFRLLIAVQSEKTLNLSLSEQELYICHLGVAAQTPPAGDDQNSQ